MTAAVPIPDPLAVFKKFFHFCHHPHQIQRCPTAFVCLFTVFTVLANLLKIFDALTDANRHLFGNSRNHFSHIFEMRQRQAGAVHFSGPLYQVMGLIDKKNIVFLCISKKAFQINIRIKNVIVITDHTVHPQRHIQLHFKRTHIMFFGISINHRCRHRTLVIDQIKNSVIDTVKMPSGPGAVHWITLWFIKNTAFILCRQYHIFKIQAPAMQKAVGFTGNSSCNRFGCEIKNLVTAPLTHDLHRREYGRNRFPCTGRCLYKQIFPPDNGLINSGYQFFLAWPVFKRKTGRTNGCIA